MAFGDWFHQTQSEQMRLQLEQARLQQDLSLAQMQAAQAQTMAGYQQNRPSSWANMPGGITSITTSSTSNGLGGYFGNTAQQVPNNLPYYVQLPTAPKQGDKITVYFDGIKWMEDRDCPSELASARAADHTGNGGFSLSELEAAQSIMEECSAG